MIEKILVPLDGSPLADRILTYVRRIVVREDAAVFLLRVLTNRSLKADPPLEDDPEAAWRHLSCLRDDLREQGATAYCDLLIARDGPAQAILEFADATFHPSLIALTTHGRTGLDRLVRGSVAEEILRHAPCPVLMANPVGFRPDLPPSEIEFRRILVPLDGSEMSTGILPDVEAIANLYGSDVVLFHSLEAYPVATLRPERIPGLSPLDVDAFLEECRSELIGEGINVHLHRTFGDAGPQILKAIASEGVDLVAMTTHGRTGLGRMLYGSVAEEVVRRASCPILIRRTAKVPRKERAGRRSRSSISRAK